MATRSVFFLRTGARSRAIASAPRVASNAQSRWQRRRPRAAPEHKRAALMVTRASRGETSSTARRGKFASALRKEGDPERRRVEDALATTVEAPPWDTACRRRPAPALARARARSAPPRARAPPLRCRGENRTRAALGGKSGACCATVARRREGGEAKGGASDAGERWR